MDTAACTDAELEDIGLKDVLQLMWHRKLLIVVSVIVLVALATAAAFILPKSYRAQILISPVANEAQNGALGQLSSIASQFGSLASLAGLSVSVDNKRFESIAMLQSEVLTEKYIQDNNLLPVLYRKKWDGASNRWKGDDPRDIPTLWKANRDFNRKIRSVDTDPKTGLVTLSITWTDPRLAAKWANDLVSLTNEYLRKQAVDESQRNVDYLTAQAAKTDVIGIRQVIYQILQSEISKEMLARGNDQYAFRILDPAAPPERPSSPDPMIWALLALFAGLFLSFGAAFAVLAWNRAP